VVTANILCGGLLSTLWVYQLTGVYLWNYNDSMLDMSK